MAIGMGLMLGFRMPLNFWSPYKAVDVTDFWRRWHITLSRFLRDYVYIPLGGNRKGSLRRNVNLMVTMLVAGIWHGAGWTFVIWGLMHGLYLVMSHMWRALQQSLHWDMDRSPRLLTVMSVLATFVAVAVAWVFFRAESVEAAVVMIKGMVGLNGVVGSGWYIDRIGLIWISLLLVICWFAPNSQEFMANYRTTFDAFGGRPVTTRNRWLRWSSTPVGATIVAGMTALAILGMSKASPFIYFQF
jgi:D-alanyl-lipoteichoic acid acyltransferase DltB (MBOAT superfamily)